MKFKIKDHYFPYIFSIMFLIYLLLLVKIILLKDVSLADLPKHLSPDYNGFRSLNLVPFRTFQDFFTIAKKGNFLWGISNIAGNALVFLPYGYFLSLRFSKKFQNFAILLSAFLLSLAFECLQFFLYLGSADIDDIILNVFGAFLGILCFRILSVIAGHQKTVIYKASLILGFAAFLGAASIGYFEFGNRLGIEYKEEVIGGEKVPKDPEDFSGYFMSGTDHKFTAANSLDPSFGKKITISLKENTTIYYLKYTSKKWTPYKTQAVYQLYTPSQLKSVKKNSRVSVWYDKTARQKTANVIVLSDPIASETSEDQKMSFPNSKTELTGYITSTRHDSQTFTLNKIDSFETKDGGSVSTSTKIYLPISYKKNVPITVRDVYGSGSSYEDRKGTVDDLTSDSFVSVKGRMKDHVFYADFILVSIFHNEGTTHQ